MSAKNEMTPAGNSRIELALIYFANCRHVLHPSAEEARKHLDVLRVALALCESPAAETPRERGTCNACKELGVQISTRLGMKCCAQCGSANVENIRTVPTPAAETWQPIASAPKDGQRILLALGGAILNEEIVIGYWDAYYAQGGRGYNGNDGWVDASSSEEVNPTLWSSLPAPPTSGAAHETKT